MREYLALLLLNIEKLLFSTVFRKKKKTWKQKKGLLDGNKQQQKKKEVHWCSCCYLGKLYWVRNGKNCTVEDRNFSTNLQEHRFVNYKWCWNFFRQKQGTATLSNPLHNYIAKHISTVISFFIYYNKSVNIGHNEYREQKNSMYSIIQINHREFFFVPPSLLLLFFFLCFFFSFQWHCTVTVGQIKKISQFN